jgi:hypothetical protein
MAAMAALQHRMIAAMAAPTLAAPRGHNPECR